MKSDAVRSPCRIAGPTHKRKTENLKMILATMAKHHVRCLPVLEEHRHLRGVLSIADIVQVPRRRGMSTAAEIIDAFKEICAPRPIEPAVG